MLEKVIQKIWGISGVGLIERCTGTSVKSSHWEMKKCILTEGCFSIAINIQMLSRREACRSVELEI